MNISDNVAAVIEKVNAAALRSGRTPEDISIVAATKMNDAPAIQAAISAGIKICGENRVQEMTEKLPLGAYSGADLQFIGHLQKNKVKNVVGVCSLIQSVDSPDLLRAIGRIASAKGLRQDVLLEVNIAGEESKSGMAPSALPGILAEAGSVEGIRVRGLMAIPPVCSNPEENRPFFQQMRKLFVDIGQKKYDNVLMDFLSMGMTNDYETAIECGSNMVRIGTGIFGPRNYGGTGNGFNG